MSAISAVTATPVNIPLKAPYEWNFGFVGGCSRTIVEVETSDGVVGLGEAPSPWDAPLIEEVLGPLLLGGDPRDHPGCEARCLPWLRELNSIADFSTLRAYTGIEMALWDIAGKLADRSVSELLGGRAHEYVPFTEYFAFRVGEEDSPAEVARYCVEMAETWGAKRFEGKVGARALDTEVAMVREIRAGLGDQVPIRIDANMAWPAVTARSALHRFEELGVESVEEPVSTLSELAAVRPTTNLGFSWHEPQLNEAVRLGVPDAFVVQMGMFGGIRRTLRFAAACQQFGIGFWFKSPDAGVATAAQLHVSATLDQLLPSQSLLRWHADDVLAEGPFVPRDGVLPVPAGPGLGVTLDRSALARCAERYAREGSYDFRPRSGPAVLGNAVTGDGPMDIVTPTSS